MSGYLVLVASVVISLAALLLSAIQGSRNLVRTASADYVRTLEERIRECEDDREGLHDEITDMKREVRRLSDREVQLMRMLVEKGVVE